MYQMSEKEGERLRGGEPRKGREMQRSMLYVPEFHLFTFREPSPARIGVSVDFLDHRGSMPSRYMSARLLQRMVSAVSEDALRFMSFDDWIMRIVEIASVDDGRRVVIRVRHVRDEDQLPKQWRTVEPAQVPCLA